MNDESETNETDEKPAFVAPDATWRMPDFLRATPEEIAAKTVTCSNCPLFFRCEAAGNKDDGGTGWVCTQCRATGVFVDDVTDPDEVKDVIALDCGKHKFHTKPDSKQIARCLFCSGQMMELELRAIKPVNHYLVTAYSKVAPLERQKVYRQGETAAALLLKEEAEAAEKERLEQEKAEADKGKGKARASR